MGSVPERLDPGIVWAEANKILASPFFRTCTRCRAFLRYIVTETLEGRAEQLKERRIGIDVFQRDPSYEPGSDSVVRTTAVDLRKRLALYYGEAGAETKLRIELPAGSYVPQFRPGADPRPVTGAPVLDSDRAAETASPAALPPVTSRRGWVLRSIAVAPLGVAGAFLATRERKQPIEAFWKFLWRSGDAVTLCIGEDLASLAAGTQPIIENSRANQVNFGDAVAMAEIAAFLAKNGKRNDIRRAAGFTLQDLKRAPTVMLGAFGNIWTLRVQEPLRFTVRNVAQHIWIADRQKPETEFVTIRSAPYAEKAVDHAVVSRIVDPSSEQAVLVLAGIGGGGVRAAGEFVTSPKHLALLAARAPGNWASKNLQVVLSVPLANGAIGSPQILATHFW